MANSLRYTPTGTRPKVLETKYGIMLLTGYYNKEGLQPISFIGDNFNGVQVSSNILCIKSCCALNTTVRQGFRHQEMGIITDPYIPDRYYFTMNTHHSDVNGVYSFLVFADEVEDDLSVARIVTSSQNLIDTKIADITENYIYVIQKHINGSGSYICRIDKNTGAISHPVYVNPSARTSYCFVTKDETYIYLCIRHVYGYWQFAKYNKTLNAVEYYGSNFCSQDTAIVPAGSCMVHEDIYENNGKYYIYNIIKQESDDFSLIGIEFDPSLPMSNPCRTFHATPYNEQIKWNVHGGYEMHRYWIKDGYLYLGIYDEQYDAGYINSINVQGIHTFKINSDGTLEHIEYNQLNSANQIISMCFSSDKKMIIIGFWQSFKIAVLNEETHQYEVPSDATYTNVASAGFDEYDRIWIQEQNNAIKMYTIYDPQQTTIKFDKRLYVYEGENIESHIEFSAENFIKEPATGLYQFQLTGDVYFKDNKKKVIEHEYEGGTLKLDIVVTSSDQLSCQVYYIKGGD